MWCNITVLTDIHFIKSNEWKSERDLRTLNEGIEEANKVVQRAQEREEIYLHQVSKRLALTPYFAFVESDYEWDNRGKGNKGMDWCCSVFLYLRAVRDAKNGDRIRILHGTYTASGRGGLHVGCFSVTYPTFNESDYTVFKDLPAEGLVEVREWYRGKELELLVGHGTYCKGKLCFTLPPGKPLCFHYRLYVLQFYNDRLAEAVPKTLTTENVFNKLWDIW